MNQQKQLNKCVSLYKDERWEDIVRLALDSTHQLKGEISDTRLLNIIGAAARATGRVDIAEAAWKRGLSSDRTNAELLNNLGVIYRETGRLQLARAAFEEATNHKPTATNFNNLGVVLYTLKQNTEAIKAYKKAIDYDNLYAEAWANLGNSLKDLYRTKEAVEAFNKALTIKPIYPWALSCLAHLKQKLANQPDAVRYVERALELDTDNPEIWLTALNVTLPLRPTTEVEGSRCIEQFDKSLEKLELWTNTPKNLKALGSRVGYSQPYFIAYRNGNHRDRLAKYGSLMSRASAAYREITKDHAITRKKAQGKIKIGIVSGFIFRHSVWDIIARGIVINLDQKIFDIYIYHTGSTQDEQTEIAKTKSKKYVQGPQTHEKWLETIKADQLDVLFYPEIGMDPYAMHMATLRLAPLQITSWGHPITSGVPTIDWYLSGEELEPAGADEHYSEKLILLPGAGVCTYPLELTPRRLVLDGAQKIDEEKSVRLFLCQHAFKYTDEAVNLLAKVCVEIPGAILFIVRDSKYPEAFDIALNQLRAAFKKEGIDDKTRLFSLPWMTREQFLGAFNHVDIYLDLPGFSGYTTAWQALSHGVPVVTLQGEFLRQRLAAGLLRVIKHDECIAKSRDEYVDIVKRLSKFKLEDREKWAAYREAISMAAPLADGNIDSVRRLESLILERFSDKLQDSGSVGEDVHMHNKGMQDRVSGEQLPLLVTQLSDIGCLSRESDKYKNRTLLFIDPFIMERASEAGFDSTQLRRIHVREDFQQSIVTEANARAIAVDCSLKRLRDSILNDVPHPGWDAQVHWMFLMRALTFRSYARYIDGLTDNGEDLPILSPTYPQHLYFDSMVSASILQSHSRRVKIESAYDYSTQWRSDLQDWMFDFGYIRKKLANSLPINALVYIPTCFHHHAYFNQLLDARYKEIINLPSLLWDVPVRRTKADRLVRWDVQCGNDIKEIAEDYAQRSKEIWVSELSDLLLDETVRDKQVEYFVQRCRIQMATYLCAKSAISSQLDIVMSDHDLGFMGPLFSAARVRGLFITIFPHSSITSPISYIPHGERVTLVQALPRNSPLFSIEGDLLNVSVDENIVPSVNRRNGEASRAGVGVKTICLLLNSLYATGLGYVDIFRLRDFYNALKEQCDARGWNLIVRPKPSGAAPRVLASTLRIELSQVLAWTSCPLIEVAQNTDFCINYGELSTAVGIFSQCGSRIFHYSPLRYPHNNWSVSPVPVTYVTDVESFFESIGES